MQTFLPYPVFEQSARVLDRARLGKQRIETQQLLSANLAGTGWKNHPAAKMWRGYEPALIVYGIAMCDEWIRRGYRDTRRPLFVEWGRELFEPGQQIEFPPFIGDPRFHASHRSNLLRKNPEHYGQFGWTEAPDMPYYWPSFAFSESGV